MPQIRNCQRRKAKRHQLQVIVFLQELVAVIDSRKKVSGNMGMSQQIAAVDVRDLGDAPDRQRTPCEHWLEAMRPVSNAKI